ncbi:MAG TPA: sugar ABC transporter substrate-binding protein, partial [Opitutaceae bacterium]|nr:sugar ABC transporter substrate-binding protein [Opitutaceae bacterium]
MSARCLIALCWMTVVSLTTGCDRSHSTSPHDQRVTVLRIWCHQGQEAENRAMRKIAEAFNAAHEPEGLRVEVSFFPDFHYTEKLSIAAAANDVPDAFEIDGPLVARFASAGWLQPLDPWISEQDRADFLPTVLEQGTIDGHLYALGAFESAVVLYFDRALFQKAGISVPQDGVSWQWPEFLENCQRLLDAGIEPASLHMDDAADEWYTYAFSPVIWSGGGQLIESTKVPNVRRILSSPQNVRSLEAWQTLFKRSYAQSDPVDPNPFGNGKVAMDWSGHWMARSHLETKGERLGVMRLPRFDARSAAPCGSWTWAMSARSRHPDKAVKWIQWVTSRDEGVIPMVQANGAIPARRSAFSAFPEYSKSPYRIFREQLEQDAKPRPRTPVYASL